jgi:hypothetical protein
MATIGVKKFRRSAVDDRLAAALSQGFSVTSAAKQSGCSERTAHRRLADPAFRSRVEELRTETLTQTTAFLVTASTSAVRVLVESLQSPSGAIRLAAARALLDSAVRFRELLSMEERLGRIEETVALMFDQRRD